MKLTLTNEQNSIFEHEFDHAWAHYRHCETLTLQYLGFFFPVVLGVLGFIGTQVKPEKDVYSGPKLFQAALLNLVLFCFCECVFVQLAKLRRAKIYHETVIFRIRTYYFGPTPFGDKLWGYSFIHPANDLGRKLYKLSFPELIINFLVFCLVVLQGTLAVSLGMFRSPCYVWRTSISAGLAVLMLCSFGLLLFGMRLIDDQTPKQPEDLFEDSSIDTAGAP